VPLLEVPVDHAELLLGQGFVADRNLSLLEILHAHVLQEDHHVTAHVSYHAPGTNDEKGDPVDEFVSSLHTIALGVHEDHDHLVEEDLDEAQGEEHDVVDEEDDRRHDQDWRVCQPKDGFVPKLGVLRGHQARGQEQKDQVEWWWQRD